jgi:hypothetical protein
MGVQNVEVLSPADLTVFPDLTDGILRPVSAVIFENDGAGGTADYSAVHEWDTVNTFDSGSLITVNDLNIGIVETAKAPTSDLGATGTTWYYRCTVTDNDDSNSASSTTISFTWFKPSAGTDNIRHLYLYDHVGVGFTPTDDPADWGVAKGGTEGPDGSTDALNRYLYFHAQVGVGFDPSDTPPDGWNGNTDLTGQDAGDDHADTFNRFLYLLENVTTTQPCPFITSITPTVGRVGDSITIKGQGLVSATSPTADAWDAEVRLYASQDHGATYKVMTIVDYTAGNTEDEIVAQIPTGATNGHVAVVHTTGATCTGSNFKFLAVIAVEPDLDAGFWIQVWSIDGQDREIAFLPITRANFQKIRNDVGGGEVIVPASLEDAADSSPLIDQFCDPPNKVERLIQVYLDGILRYSFFSHSREDVYDEKGNKTGTRIFGPGRESIVNWAIVPPADYPEAIITNPDTVFGSTVNAVVNGSFDDGNDPLTNGGFEDGVKTPWERVGTGVDSIENTIVRSGGFSLQVNTTALNDGVRQSIPVTPGLTYFLEGYARDSLAAGHTIQTRAYWIDSDDVEQALDSDTLILNVSWRINQLSFTVPEGVSTVYYEWRQTTGSVPSVFYIDDNTGVGAIQPWTRNTTAIGTTAGLDDTYAADGSYSLKVVADAQGRGVGQRVRVNPSTKYTFVVRATGTATNDVTLRVGIGNTSISDTVSLTGLGTFDTLTVTGTTANDQTVARLFVVSEEATTQTFWIDAVTATPGEPAADPGTILGPLLTAAQTRGVITFASWVFNGTSDSDGDAWLDTNLSFGLRHGDKLLKVLDRLVAFGFSWEVTDTFEIRLLNRLGIDLTQLGDEAPILTAGKLLTDGDIAGDNPRDTFVFAEGAGGIWTTNSEPTWETDLERRESWIVNPEASDTTTLGKLASARLADEESRGRSLKFVMARGDTLRPFVDFDIGDTIWVDVADEGIPKEAFVVVSITVNLDAEHGGVRYILDLNRLRYERDAQVAAELHRMIERGDDVTLSIGAGTIGSTPPGSTSTLLLGSPPGGGTVPEHEHLTTDLVDGELAGDVLGPIASNIVKGIQGRAIADGAPGAGGFLYLKSGVWVPMAAVTGDPSMVFYDGSDWVEVTGTAATDNVPTVQSDGTVAWETPAGGGGGGADYSPILDDKATTDDPPDDEFDDTTGMSGSVNGLDSKWTAVDGSSGTVDFLTETPSDTGIYDFSTRPGWMMLQVQNNAGTTLSLRQDYTLPNNKMVIMAFSMPFVRAGDSNEFEIHMNLNDSDTSQIAGTSVELRMRVLANGLGAQAGLNGLQDAGATAVPAASMIFMGWMRADDGATEKYTAIYSVDGTTWNMLTDASSDSYQPGSVMNNLWVSASSNASSTAVPAPIGGIYWVRLGNALTSGVMDPW